METIIDKFIQQGQFRVQYQTRLPHNVMVELSIPYLIADPTRFKAALVEHLEPLAIKSMLDIQNQLQNWYLQPDEEAEFVFALSNGISCDGENIAFA